MAKPVPERLRAAADLFSQRNAVYGDNFRNFGPVMAALFPPGSDLFIETPEDWNRLGILVQVVAKLSRYTANFQKGGHADSLDDIAVYSQILALLDAEKEEHKARKLVP